MAAGKSEWIDQVNRLFAGRDYLRALDVIAEAKRDFPGDSELEQLEAYAWRGLQRGSEVGQLVTKGDREAREGRHEESLATFQQAYSIDSRNAAVRAGYLSALVERAKALVEATPGDAEPLLKQAIEIDPANPQAKELLDQVEGRRRERIVDACLYQARWLQSQGDVTGAVRAIDGGLKKFPNEPRLLELRASFDVAPPPLATPTPPPATKPPEPATPTPTPPAVKAPEAEPIKADPLRAEPVKPMLTEAFAPPKQPGWQWEDRPATTPASPPQGKTSGTVTDPVPPAAAPAEPKPPKPAPAKPTPAPAKAFRAPLTRTQIYAGAGAAAAILLIFAAVVFFGGRKPQAPTTSTAEQKATLEISTSPAGAIVSVDGKDMDTAALMAGVPIDAGPVQIEARLPGYQTTRVSANLRAGVRTPVAVTLTPVLALRLLIPGDGQVAVNGEPPMPVEGGTFSRELTPGTYSVKVTSGKTGSLNFAFQVDRGGPVILSAPPNAKEVSALLISNFGDQARIYNTGKAVKVKLDGQDVGELNPNGLDLPKVSAGSHEIALGEKQELSKKSADFGPGRTLTAIIDSDPSTGTLVVQTSEDGAAISVLAGGKEVAHGQSKNGRFRVANLGARAYVVRASKDGFDTDTAEQTANIVKGQDKTVAFAFRRRPQAGAVRVHIPAGAELLVDGNPVSVSGETFIASELKPGPHIFRVQKGKQFVPNSKTVDVVAGQTTDVELQLAAASIAVEIRRSPADSIVTYARAGDPTVRTFNGSRQELPEGDYTFTARAKGYLERVQELHLSFDFAGPLDLSESLPKPTVQSFALADWGKGVWTETPGWFERKGGGLVFFPKPLGTGTIEFTIRWQGKGRAQWVVNATDSNNYLQGELDDESFQIFRVTAGKKPQALGKKKPVAKLQFYGIRIEVKADTVTTKVQNGGSWETLDTQPDTAPADGKFGFNIPNKQELFLANFSMKPDR